MKSKKKSIAKFMDLYELCKSQENNQKKIEIGDFSRNLEKELQKFFERKDYNGKVIPY